MLRLGRHLILELSGCDAEVLNDLDTVKRSLVEAARRAGATVVSTSFNRVNPFGVSGVVLIAESHLSIHTWPKYRYAAVDVFTCGDGLNPASAFSYLITQFAAERTATVEVPRGVFYGAAAASSRRFASADVER